MNFIEATSSGKDFRHPDMGEGEYFGFNGDELELFDASGHGVFPRFVHKDFTREDYEFVVDEAIEVGDEIHVKNHPAPEVMSNMICDVIQIKDRIVSFEARITYFADIDDCVLVEKGPKVHTFEGMRWEQSHEGYAVPSRSSTYLVRDFINDGNTYRMTLTEEVSDG